ncbi:MAG TPA: phosphoribosylglycinamide formyltransferase [Eggerthellaceae bacterium]|nr:phosphoribosylglycinamide formyltransferase [Eggerthellaceae bacterium]
MSNVLKPLKIGVLISGSGSNLQAIIDRIAEGFLNAEIVLVISSRPDAYGLERAAKAGIPSIALNREVYKDAQAANKQIADALKEAGAEYVIMAGYMRKVTNEVLDAFPDRIVNLHPALLPSFKGAHAIEDAFNFGVKVTGITVHFANEDYDKGPIIAQRAVEVRESDTLDSLEERIHEAEHALYPEVLSWLAAGRVQIDPETRTVHISD